MSDSRRDEGFLSRWSRRKRSEPDSREREDRRVQEESAVAGGTALPAAVVPEAAPPQAVPGDLPSIDSLTPDSDFSRFMRPDVPLASRNAAMKKLFADPHFNVMDGLDTYIDDYTVADPIPTAMLRELAQSQMLKLFDSEEEARADGAQVESAQTRPAPAEDAIRSTAAIGANSGPAGVETDAASGPAAFAGPPSTS
ncbi:MAG: DUF3306 domain-containing protein [Burkholderiales bacterium]|nr:DUF3306 domain-containing protein [Burkholderiales bacterium]